MTLDGTTWLVNDTSKTCTKVDPAEMSGGFDTDFSCLSFEERGEGFFDGETLRLRPLPTSGKVDLGASKLLQTLRERRQSLL